MEANDAQSTKYHPTRMIKKLNESTLFDAVIVANGLFPTSQLAWHFLKNSPYICCCDGAGATLIEHGLVPHAIVTTSIKRAVSRHSTCCLRARQQRFNQSYFALQKLRF